MDKFWGRSKEKIDGERKIYTKCIICGFKKNRHKGHGVCNVCYEIGRKKEKADHFYKKYGKGKKRLKY